MRFFQKYGRFYPTTRLFHKLQVLRYIVVAPVFLSIVAKFFKGEMKILGQNDLELGVTLTFSNRTNAIVLPLVSINTIPSGIHVSIVVFL